MSEIKLKKKRRWPIIAAIILLLIGCVAVYGYCNGYLNCNKTSSTGETADVQNSKTNDNTDAEQNTNSLIHSSKADDDNVSVSCTENSSEPVKDPTKPERSDDGSSSGNTVTEKKGHWETRYETIPAWDEQVLVKEGWYESVLVKDAWDEEVWDDGAYFGPDMEEVAVCSGCGAVFHDDSINQHLEDHPEHGGWYNDFIAVSAPYWHGTKHIVHHEAKYRQVWHDPEYRTVHHPEETRSYQVWVND